MMHTQWLTLFVFHFVLYNLNINILELYNKRKNNYSIPTNEDETSEINETLNLANDKLNENILELKEGINKLKNINDTIYNV
mgnify:CR=1 FL=1